MAEAVAFKNLNIDSYKSYFCRAYLTNKILRESKQKDFDALHISAEGRWDLCEKESEEHEDCERLLLEVLRFVSEKYSYYEFRIFYHWLHNKTNSKEIKGKFGASLQEYRRIVSSILKEVKVKFKDYK